MARVHRRRSVGVLAVVLAVVLVAAGCAGGGADRGAQQAGTTVAASIGEGVRGPAGLVASVYARGVDHVSAFALDDLGRLWVATAASGDEGKDAVSVVSSVGAVPVEVITDVHTPMGLLWIGDTLYVASVGRVDAFRGFDGSAFANVHPVVQLPDGMGLSGALVRARDGRLQLGIAAPCDSCTPTSEYAASIVSFLPDGTDLRVDARSIRAPVGLAYYPGTDDLFVTMNQRDDLGASTPGDWLSVVRRGQDWGFPTCYGQADAACASVPKPVAVLDPHAAVSDLAIITGQLGPTVGTAAVVAEWATGKVQRVALEKHGDTYTGTAEPFLTGIEKPVAVLLNPEGALLVGDWASGTVYRIAPAPTSGGASTSPISSANPAH